MLAHVNLTAMPFDPDTASYLFQARLFAQGMPFAEAPPDFGFSASPHINIHDGKWYSRYPPMAAVLLMPGVWLGHPVIVPAFLSAATMIFVFLFVRELFGSDRVALVAAAFALISPATLGIGSTLFSQSGSRLFLVIYLWALIRAIRARRASYAVVAGACLGLAFNVRPLTAVTFAGAGALFSLVALIGAERRMDLARQLPAFLLPLALLVGATLAWNYALTGHALQMTFNVMQPNDRLGFGMRGEGYPGNLEGVREFGPSAAWERTLEHTVPDYLYNALGWGRYEPQMLDGLSPYADWAGAGLLIKSRKSGDWVDLRVQGGPDGSAIVQLRAKGHPDPVAVSRAIATDPRPGRATVTLYVARRGNEFSGAYRLADAEAVYEAVGAISRPLEPPLQVGVFAIRGNVGTAVASFDGVRGIVENDFREIPGEWTRTAENAVYRAADGRLRITPPPNSHLTDIDSSAGLYRVIEASDLALETTVSLDWVRPWPIRLANWAWMVPMAITFVLALLAFAERRFRGAASFCLVIIVAHHVGQFFYWSDHATWGFTPVAVLYYAEMVTIALIPLVACGATVAYAFVAARWRRGRVLMLAALGALLVNTAYAYARFMPLYREWHPVYQHLPAVVEDAKLTNAVVFVKGGRNAPVGDYPFVALPDAGVVYYRLGPWNAFGLPGESWGAVYERYFRERTPYLVDWHTLGEGGNALWRPRLRRVFPRATGE